MPRSRSVLFVVLAVALLGLGIWLLNGGGQPNLDTESNSNPVAAATSAASLQADADAKAGQPTAGILAERRVVTTGAADAPTIGIVGQVVDAGGKPVAAARVVCRATTDFEFDPDTFDPDDFDADTMRERFRNTRGAALEATTDAAGKFRVGAPAGGRNVQLRVQARAHLVLDRNNVQRPVDRDVDLGALTVLTGAVVSGRVLDGAGQPIAEARVARRGARGRGGEGGEFQFQFLGGDFADRFGGDSGDDVRTDKDGRFELAHVAPGSFALLARHDEHPPARRDGLSVAPGEVLNDVVVTVDPGATIRGKLIEVPEGTQRLRVLASIPPANDAPAAGILSMVGDMSEMIGDLGGAERTVDVAADGTFTLRGLAVGQTYRVWAAQRGRGFTGNALCSQRREVLSGVQDLELRYEAGVTVTFSVVDAGTKAALEKLWVSDRLVGNSNEGFDFMAFAPSMTRARAYPDGRVTIANLRPKKKQTLTLAVEALGFKKQERKGIELPLVGSIDLGTLQLEPTPLVKVQVRSAIDGAPVAGASVQLRERQEKAAGNSFEVITRMESSSSPQSAKTDGEGRAVINGIAGAKIAISVKGRDFAPYESDDMTLNERGAEHEARLLRGGSVEVTVLDSDGKPVAETSVDHKGPHEARGNQRSGADGIARFAHLAPGKHQFKLGGRASRIEGGGNFSMRMRTGGNEATADDWQSVDVIDEVQATLRLAKAAVATLSGFVRENGVPLAGAQLTLVKGVGDDETEAAIGQILEATFANLPGGGRGSSRGRTDDMGKYELKDLPVGEHRLRITHRERAMPSTVRVSTRVGSNAFDVDLGTTILRGTVLDHNGKPVVGATVSAALAIAAAAAPATRALEVMGGMPELAQFSGRRGTQVTTDAQGRYELRGVQDGQSILVRAQAKGFAAASSKPVQPARGTTTEGVDVQLLAAGSVRVRAATQAPFASVTATCTSMEGATPVTRMLRRGEATLDGLQPGTWRIALQLPGTPAAEPRSVEVVAGKVAEVAF